MKKVKKYEIKISFETEFDFEEEKIQNWLKNQCSKMEQYHPDGADDKKTGFLGEVQCYRVDVNNFPRRVFAEVRQTIEERYIHG